MKAYQLKTDIHRSTIQQMVQASGPGKAFFSQPSVVINTCFSLKWRIQSFVFENQRRNQGGGTGRNVQAGEADAPWYWWKLFEQESLRLLVKNLAPAVIEIEWEAAVLDRKECFPEIVEVNPKARKKTTVIFRKSMRSWQECSF